jgi:hypothetical protein
MIPIYLDPGSGSLLIQLLIAGLGSLVIVIAAGWRKIKHLFGLSKPNPKEEDE